MIRIYRPASDETLTIVVEQVHRDERHKLADTALLEREGQERELHEHLARAPHLIEAGLAVVERERLTDVGPVDLWCRDAEGRVALVEVKRVRAVAAAVDQVVRYREQALRNAALGEIRALVVAPDFAPQAKVHGRGARRGVHRARRAAAHGRGRARTTSRCSPDAAQAATRRPGTAASTGPPKASRAWRSAGHALAHVDVREHERLAPASRAMRPASPAGGGPREDGSAVASRKQQVGAGGVLGERGVSAVSPEYTSAAPPASTRIACEVPGCRNSRNVSSRRRSRARCPARTRERDATLR